MVLYRRNLDPSTLSFSVPSSSSHPPRSANHGTGPLVLHASSSNRLGSKQVHPDKKRNRENNNHKPFFFNCVVVPRRRRRACLSLCRKLWYNFVCTRARARVCVGGRGGGVCEWVCQIWTVKFYPVHFLYPKRSCRKCAELKDTLGTCANFSLVWSTKPGPIHSRANGNTCFFLFRCATWDEDRCRKKLVDGVVVPFLFLLFLVFWRWRWEPGVPSQTWQSIEEEDGHQWCRR